MSTSFGNKLPPRVLNYLHFEKSVRDNTVIFMLTGDPNGFPHVAMLSPFQVVTAGEDEFFLAVHNGTKSQKYLHDSGKGTIILQADPAVDYIKFSIEEIDGWRSHKDEVLYRATPIEVLEDYSEKVPYPSQLKFDSKEILDDYKLGFEEIREYIRNH